jgi:hypothetical protein
MNPTADWTPPDTEDDYLEPQTSAERRQVIVAILATAVIDLLLAEREQARGDHDVATH